MITTVTLNPALDQLLATDELAVGDTNRTRLLSESAAGKGIDVAKVLRDLDCRVNATGFLGGDVAGIFVRCFKDEKIGNYFIRIKESTRTNIQLFEKSGRRTELLEAGPSVSHEECASLMEQFKKLASASDAVTICGSVPAGVDKDYFLNLVRTARHSCRCVIVDTSGEWLKLAVDQKPDLIKPNRKEITELMGREKADDAEIIAFGQQLVRQGVPYILVSLGGDGAMLICDSGVWRGQAPDIEVKSTLGCGDSMVASLSVSLSEQLPPEEMLKKSIALSAANAMTFETAHVILDDYKKLLHEVHIEKIER
ncbi:1-phosphofructokinase [Sporolactobacillus sp. CQH2019]|uniref:1-phosphofructokinase n=1 Tax=Sporolactobacillus sp. CQH2019 TaxID=3023512 RepID=UPI002368982A|nr:1-phosphofructokinase [Sporolactobacillus sp. CQH2019]MDD9148954.1 1-phosphofructokinase [Sporolactobacillus sp. CQH2019]